MHVEACIRFVIFLQQILTWELAPDLTSKCCSREGNTGRKVLLWPMNPLFPLSPQNPNPNLNPRVRAFKTRVSHMERGFSAPPAVSLSLAWRGLASRGGAAGAGISAATAIARAAPPPPRGSRGCSLYVWACESSHGWLVALSHWDTEGLAWGNVASSLSFLGMPAFLWGVPSPTGWGDAAPAEAPGLLFLPVLN